MGHCHHLTPLSFFFTLNNQMMSHFKYLLQVGKPGPRHTTAIVCLNVNLLHISTEAELSSQDETNTAEMIDLMFKDMLEASARGREKEGTEDYDSGIATVMRRKEKTELDKEKAEEGEDLEEIRELHSSVDELLTLPPSCILSPLSRSVEAVVTPMVRLCRQTKGTRVTLFNVILKVLPCSFKAWSVYTSKLTSKCFNIPAETCS